MSLRVSTGIALACSGDMYCGVPTTMPTAVWPPVPVAGDHLGDAEVEHLDEVGLPGPLQQHDVLGLQIAVHDALRVRGGQRRHDLQAATLQHALGGLGALPVR